MTASPRAAAIDIGTSSVLLLVAERRGEELVPVLERATITRLGQGVDRARRLAPDAVDRTLACLAGYAAELCAAGAQRVDVVGTSALRDAQGGSDFVARATALLGIAPRVISGDEEAHLTFEGALAGLGLAPGPVLVFDVGGGSTELIAGEAPDRVVAAASMDVGSVRLTERHVRSDPPASSELDAARADARRALEALGESFGSPTPSPLAVVGVAGTVTTIAALVHAVAPYDGARVHGARVTTASVAALVERLRSVPLGERREMRGLDPARADVIVAGTVLVHEILEWLARRTGHAAELVASDRGVRWGLVRRLLGA